MEENKDYMLTTNDNPYDPFDEFDEWFMFDVEQGYYTCAYLARIAKITEDMSQIERDRETDRAIDEIITLNPLGIYKRVERTV